MSEVTNITATLPELVELNEAEIDAVAGGFSFAFTVIYEGATYNVTLSPGQLTVNGVSYP
jgi:hypothetical protein